MVSGGPELGLAVGVMFPVDDLLGRQDPVNGAVEAEVEALEGAEVKMQRHGGAGEGFRLSCCMVVSPCLKRPCRPLFFPEAGVCFHSPLKHPRLLGKRNKTRPGPAGGRTTPGHGGVGQAGAATGCTLRDSGVGSREEAGRGRELTGARKRAAGLSWRGGCIHQADTDGPRANDTASPAWGRDHWPPQSASPRGLTARSTAESTCRDATDSPPRPPGGESVAALWRRAILGGAAKDRAPDAGGVSQGGAGFRNPRRPPRGHRAKSG